MAIIVSKNGKGAERIEQTNFGLEDKLQAYIYDNPDSIPLYDIDEDIRLFIAAREFPTKSGPIDALGFDASGNIYVVETKLYKNPDKRTVVAQALDYGASLWRHATDFGEFSNELDKHCQKQFGQDFKESYEQFFSLDEAAENIATIQANLADGVIKFVVLMDHLHDALKDLVVFVNQNSKFDLYAVELEYYKHAEFEIVIPKLFGAEVKKDITSTKSTRSAWSWTETNEQDFIDRLDDQVAKEPKTPVERIKRTIEVATQAANQLGGRVQYGHVVSKTRDSGKFILCNSFDKAVFYIDTDGSSGFYMWDKASNFDAANRSMRDSLIDHKLFGKATANRDATQILFNLKNATDEEFGTFIQLYREVTKRQ